MQVQKPSTSSTKNRLRIFLGDFNTLDWRGVRRQLEESTGWDWPLGGIHDQMLLRVALLPKNPFFADAILKEQHLM